jgi:hypothetical protein
MSLTVTVNEQLSSLPAASVATLLTVVTPLGNVDPDAGVETIDRPGQLSVAATVKLTAVLHWPGSVFCVIFAGQVILGF